jgi:aryl-alcohol dehydrogenase-like predicted oxidoreductase
MNSRKLGQSDIDISTIGLGTNYVGGHNLYADVDEAEGIRLVQRAIDEGVTHLDTAYLHY